MNELQHWWEFQKPMKLVGQQPYIMPSKSYHKEEVRNEMVQNGRSKTFKKKEQQKPFQKAYLRDLESSNHIETVIGIHYDN